MTEWHYNWDAWQQYVAFRVFEKKHGTAERWNVCDCEECAAGRAPLDRALAEERARREARPAWHDDSLPLASKEPKP